MNNEVYISKQEMADKVRVHFKNCFRCLKEAGYEYGVDANKASAMQTGKRAPSKAILKGFGYERVYVYRKAGGE